MPFNNEQTDDAQQTQYNYSEKIGSVGFGKDVNVVFFGVAYNADIPSSSPTWKTSLIMNQHRQDTRSLVNSLGHALCESE